MRLHVVGLPHTETTRNFPTCAYTGKLLRFGAMMLDQGHDVFLYSGENNEADCTEHIPVLTAAERLEWCGPHDQNTLWGNVSWNPDDKQWKVMNARAVAEIAKRCEPRDLLCLGMGLSQQFISKSLPTLTACEPFVGYEGISTQYRAFESYAWKHYMYAKRGIETGQFYDVVIPNYFDPREFIERDRQDRDSYLLFVGRVIERKGPHIAAKIAGALGRRLIVAGPGGVQDGPGKLLGLNCVLEGKHVEYVGPVGVRERAELMSKAACLLAPTMYIEPFGGVVVEAMMCGTPVVTTDWGAFTETVIPGLTGYRFHTLADGVQAVLDTEMLVPSVIADCARERFSLDAVGPQFDRWFRQLDGLWDGGWGVYTAPQG